MQVHADQPLDPDEVKEYELPLTAGVIYEVLTLYDGAYDAVRDGRYLEEDVDRLASQLEKVKPRNGLVKLRLNKAQLELLEERIDWARTPRVEESPVLYSSFMRALRHLRALIAGEPPPAVNKKKTTRRTFETFDKQIGGIDISLRNFSEKDPRHKAALDAMKHMAPLFGQQLRRMFGGRTVMPEVVMEFGKPSRKNARGLFHWAHTVQYRDQFGRKRFTPPTDKNMIELLIENYGNPGDWREHMETIAHEYGHYLWRKYLTKEATQFWAKDFEEDTERLDIKDVLQQMEPGETTWTFMERIKEEDGLLWRKLVNLGFHNHGFNHWQKYGKLKTRKHPITQYGETDPEEAFCEAFGLYMAYGPRTLHPAVRQRLSIVLPEARIATSRYAADLLEAAAMRIYASLKGTNMVQLYLANKMGMDLMDWILKYAKDFRHIYEKTPDVKQAIDADKIDEALVQKVADLLQQPVQ